MPRKYTRNDPSIRFWAKVDKNGPTSDYRPDLGPCWLWVCGLDRDGYGRFWDRDRELRAHRWAYQFLVGSVPPSLELDHLCRVRHCVNPHHLEPVTHLKNIRRGDHAEKTCCSQGHPFDATNTYQHRGKRFCRTCHRERERKRYQRVTQVTTS